MLHTRNNNIIKFVTLYLIIHFLQQHMTFTILQNMYVMYIIKFLNKQIHYFLFSYRNNFWALCKYSVIALKSTEREIKHSLGSCLTILQDLHCLYSYKKQRLSGKTTFSFSIFELKMCLWNRRWRISDSEHNLFSL